MKLSWFSNFLKHTFIRTILNFDLFKCEAENVKIESSL